MFEEVIATDKPPDNIWYIKSIGGFNELPMFCISMCVKSVRYPKC